MLDIIYPHWLQQTLNNAAYRAGMLDAHKLGWPQDYRIHLLEGHGAQYLAGFTNGHFWHWSNSRPIV